MRNYHIYIFLLIVFGFVLFTKLVSAEPEGSEKPKKGLIEGWVTEQEQNIPVEYANVVVFSTIDSAMVSGGITGPEGQFKLDNIPFGEYYVVINFIGFEKKTIDQVVISEFERKIDLGKIQLGYSAVQLQGTEIVAERQAVEFKLDKKVINVDQDISSAGSSATDILQNAPSVRVDIEGNVQLRGSSNFTVLIDGKPSILSGNEALQQIPATAIENIEIITNPSAKYDPDGTSGIINIVMKKQNLKGFSGMVEASAGTGDKYTSNLYLNYRNGKFNVYGGVEWNDRRFPRTETAIRETYSGDTTFVRLTDSESAWKRNGLNFKGGIDFSPDDKTTFSLGGEYGNYGFGWDNFSNVHEYSNPASTERYYRDNNIFAWDRYSFGLNASMMRKFRQEGHTLNVFAFYSERGGKQEQDKKEIDTDENYEPIDSDPFMLRSIEEGPSKRFRAEIDYVKPVLENGKIEAGYHLRMGDEEESYLLETYDVDLNEWQVDDNYTKKALYTRNIHAIYGMFAHEFKGFEYQAGIRAEYTYRDITVANTGESSTIDRFDFFPSVHISKRFLEKNQFSASYSRRIDRPRGWYLEPFETFIDESTRRIGNPDLLPEYTDSYEVGYLRTLKSGNISTDVFFRKTDNKITRVQSFDEEAGLIYNEFRNLNNDRALGTEASFMYDFTDWLNVNLSGSYYYYEVEDLTGETSGLRSSNNWDTRAMTTFKLPTNTRIQVNFSYESPSASAQGRREGYHYTDITVRQDFFDKKLNATLRVSDLFGTRIEESYVYGDNLYEFEREIPESRVVTFTLSYRLNNFKKHSDRGDSGGMDM